MRIKILQVDIDLGLKGSCNECPIALACIRHFATDDIEVDFGCITVEDKIYILDTRGRKFILNFDGGRKVSPCEITI